MSEILRYKLESANIGLIMHSRALADPEHPKVAEKEKLGKAKTQEARAKLARLQWEYSLYTNSDNRIILPAENLKAMLVKAAIKRNRGLKDIVKSKLHIYGDDPLLEYDGPQDLDALWNKGGRYRYRKAVQINNATVFTVRPIFPIWSITVELDWTQDKQLPIEVVDDLLLIGGTEVGLCDRRPDYGRFNATRMK